jgi:hypothetical protein
LYCLLLCSFLVLRDPHSAREVPGVAVVRCAGLSVCCCRALSCLHRELWLRHYIDGCNKSAIGQTMFCKAGKRCQSEFKLPPRSRYCSVQERVHVSTYSYIQSSIHPSNHPSIHPPIHPSITWLSRYIAPWPLLFQHLTFIVIAAYCFGSTCVLACPDAVL